MKRIITILILVQAVFYCGCSKKEDVIAYVGRKKITVKDFRNKIGNLPDYYMGFMATQGGKRQYLSGMIKEEVLLHKARDLDIDKRSEVAKRLENAKREVLLGAVIGYMNENKVRISDQDIRDYYEKNKEEFINPKQIKVSHILLSDEKSAKEVLEKLKKGASFTNLAREYSIDTVTAINGGDLGYFSKGDMSQPEFEDGVFKLEKIGQISDIIKTPFGYHIAKLTGRRKGKEKVFEEAGNEIRMKLEKEKFNILIERYRKDYNVRVNYDVLDEIVLQEENSIEE